MRRALVALSFLLALTGAGPAEAGPGEPVECNAPAEVYSDEARLPAVAERIAARSEVRIVAIGGASTAGLATGALDRSYPMRLGAILQKRLPGLRVSVVNLAQRRQFADVQLKRIRSEALPQHPTLVIWEPGAFDAVHGRDPHEFTQTVQDGIEAVKAAGADLMLVDFQFGRPVEALVDVSPYRDVLGWLTEANGVYLFRRYALMRYWAQEGVFNYMDPPAHDFGRLASDVYDCIARRMADAVIAAASPGPAQ